MSHSQEVTDTHLRLQAARRIHEASLCRLEAAIYAGVTSEIELSTSALLDTSQAIADRLQDAIFALMRKDRIDPITRRSF